MNTNSKTAVIINDCRDQNASVRQQVRLGSLLNCQVHFIGVTNDLEASFNLNDMLDSAEGDSVILVNVAPRNGPARKWGNGTPFGYFRYRKHHVFATVDGLTLSVPNHLGIVRGVDLFDVASSVGKLKSEGYIPDKRANRITQSQFRSFDFLPLVAHFIHTGGTLPHTEHSEIPALPKNTVAVIDCFGNCKTTLLRSGRWFQEGRRIKINGVAATCSHQLRMIPDGELGLVIGSSGLKDCRFLEIVLQGGSASEKLGLKSGDKFTLEF